MRQCDILAIIAILEIMLEVEKEVIRPLNKGDNRNISKEFLSYWGREMKWGNTEKKLITAYMKLKAEQKKYAAELCEKAGWGKVEEANMKETKINF